MAKPDYDDSLFPEWHLQTAAEDSIPRSRNSSVRQEVLNVLMAQLLQERGTVAAPEQILRDPLGRRRMPDLLVVNYEGLRLAIEGEIASPSAKKKAGRSALQRLEDGIAHIAMALVYPAHLRRMGRDAALLKKALSEETHLEFAVVTESEITEAQLSFPDQSEKQVEFARFLRGDLNGLLGELNRAYEQLAKDNVLERAAQAVDTAIGTFLNTIDITPAMTAQFAEILEIRPLPKRKKSKPRKRQKETE